MDVSIAGTTADTASDTEEIIQPPCRAAELYLVQCPHCGRRMRLKTLRYSHVCGRSFFIQDRADEQHIAAEAAINARMLKLEQTATQRVQHTAGVAPINGTTKDYSRLLNFLERS
mgnify:CR=1 FL=1